jgi:hypothetical protein
MQQHVEPARTRKQRLEDTLALLEHPKPPHIVLATVNRDGLTPYLAPLTFYWDGHQLTMGLVEPQRTAANLRRTGWAHGMLGSTLDVVMVEGPVTLHSADEIDPAIGDALKARWTNPNIDFRTMPGFVLAQLHPRRIKAYRPGYAERDDRDLMLDGKWLV